MLTHMSPYLTYNLLADDHNKLFFLTKLPWCISKCPQSFPQELKAAIILINPTCIEGDDDHNLQLSSSTLSFRPTAAAMVAMNIPQRNATRDDAVRLDRHAVALAIPPSLAS